jgi:outer membrane immunogenic protein
MRKQLLCGVAGIAVTAAIGDASLAADLPLKARPFEVVRPLTWDGFYVGGHVGWAKAKFTATPHEGEEGDGIATSKPTGLVWGMHGGWNSQRNNWVWGVEADVSGAGLDEFSVFSNNTDRRFTTQVDLLASLRGRLGLAFDRWLVYATGGLAYTQAKFLGVSPGGTLTPGKFKRWGSVFGGGIEWKGTPNVSVRLEGLYYYFNSKKPIYGSANLDQETFEPAGTATFKDVAVVRVGATYHFN